MQPIESVSGEKVRIAAMDASHAEGPYLGWLKDEAVTRFLEARLTDYDGGRLRAYIDAENQRPNTVFFGVFTIDDGRHVGTVKLAQISSAHRHCELGLMIGDRSVWGQGIGTETIALATDYAFRVLGLHKVNAGAYSDNVASQRAFLKVGYSIEGRCLEDRWNGAAWVDRVMLGRINPAER